jgi:hypothetical protein
MRSLIAKFQVSSLLLGGLAVLSACGSDGGGGGHTNQYDAAIYVPPGSDGGNPGGGFDGGIPQGGTPGTPCTGAGGICTKNGQQGFEQCTNGVWGECTTAADILGDGGLLSHLGDGGFGGLFGDAGFTYGDGGAIDVPGTPCPTSLPCSTTVGPLLMGFGAPIPAGKSVCAASGTFGFPPSCSGSDTTACKSAGLTAAACLANYCLQFCDTP